MLPQYKCHKVVGAAKITAVVYAGHELPDGAPSPQLQLEGAPNILIKQAWLDIHTPLKGEPGNETVVGGYLVAYQPDGYLSWSPAAVFEAGYTLVDEPADIRQTELQLEVDNITAK